MEKKIKELNENLGQNQADLEEILGDIKSVVREETETLFKKKEQQKIIKLKKSDLVNFGQKEKHELDVLYIKRSEVESIIKRIVLQELKKERKVPKVGKKTKNEINLPSKENINLLNKMTKTQLEEIGRKNGIELDRRKTKVSLIKELNDSGIK